MIDFTQSHFALFGLPQTFAQDSRVLDARYREQVAAYHPDRFASAPDAEKRLSLQAATRVNEAYQTLKNPLSRARYLLQLAGVDTEEETNTAMPMDFLMAQMQWREAIEDARAQQNVDALEKLNLELRAEVDALEAHLAQLLDTLHDFTAAALAVRKLRFFEKLEEEVGNAIEKVLF
jgi:molecular chaperone HscB